ncbi:hypothetical protein HYV87_03755 [Candidatus Woesearchaeota archaeon]|nr:hypothetical protein [Candidatus Woesearchaeota archaeon]MBI2582210.1 hypothetical protein [Candidatus Woesearchaeota archaeon]
MNSPIKTGSLATIITMAGAFSTAGCSVRQYTLLEIAYAREDSVAEGIDLIGGRFRHGVIERDRKEEIQELQSELEKAEVLGLSQQEEELEKKLEEAKAAEESRMGRREEVRIGIDVYHAKLPPTVKETPSSISLLPNYVNQAIPPIIETTESELIRLSPALEYKLGSIGTNFPGDAPLRDQDLNDLSFSLWAGIGYNLDLTVKNKSYSTPLGPFNDIPGFKFDGAPYFAFTPAVTVLKLLNLETSIQVDPEGNVTPIVSGGGQIPWYKF